MNFPSQVTLSSGRIWGYVLASSLSDREEHDVTGFCCCCCYWVFGFVLLWFVFFCFFLQTNKFEDGEIHLRDHEHIRPSDYISLTRQYSVTTANVLSIELYRHERWFLPAPTGTGVSCNFLMDEVSSQHWNPVSVWIWSCQHQPPWKSRCLPE